MRVINRFEPRAHGAIVVDGREIGSTLQCCHCGGHFVSVKGSGARRGYCLRCGGVTCGSPACDTCKPHEVQLLEMEKR